MNSVVSNLLYKLEQCDDYHNRCDYLMEHSEITYLLEYIKELHDLLDKYEEEHNTTFVEWSHGIKKMVDARKYLEDFYDNYYDYSFDEERDKIYTAIEMLEGEENEQGKDN